MFNPASARSAHAPSNSAPNVVVLSHEEAGRTTFRPGRSQAPNMGASLRVPQPPASADGPGPQKPRRLMYGDNMPLRNGESLRYCRDIHSKYSAVLSRPVTGNSPAVSPRNSYVHGTQARWQAR